MMLSELNLSNETKAIIASNLTVAMLTLVAKENKEKNAQNEVNKWFRHYLKLLFEDLKIFEIILDRL